MPLGVAFFAMPIAAHHLGPARFGLLGLAWAITEYLVLFDLGLGRTIVKFIADALRRGPDDVSEVASLATSIQLIAGVVGGALFALAAPFVVAHGLNLTGPLADEAVSMLRVVALNLPVVVLLGALRGVLEGAERFDLSNSVKTLGSAATALLPAIGAIQGESLATIFWWIFLSRSAACVLYLLAIRSALPSLHWHFPRRWTRARQLFVFSGWVFVSNAASPVLVYFDRFSLGAIVGVAAVGFYTAPYEAVTRLLLIPVSVMSSLYPALTALEVTRDRSSLVELLSSSTRSLLVLISPPLALIFAFAPVLLTLWLGPVYAAEASTALRILAVGVLANAMAHPPYIALYAMNRPDLPAKFHLAELVIHIPLTVWLVSTFGIAGAAAAWASRVWIDLLLLLTAVSRSTGMSIADAAGGRLGRVAPALAALVVLLSIAATLTSSNALLGAGLTISTVLAFGWFSWSFILRGAERAALRGLISGRLAGRSDSPAGPG